MCGRYSLIADIGELQERFGFDGSELTHAPRYNVAPTQMALTVINGSERRGSYMRWGLIPSWAKSASVGNRMINARAETVVEMPSFRTALQRRRCLVLADGFYEWQGKGSSRRPMRITMASGEPFAFAGLWDAWRDPKGEVVRSCGHHYHVGQRVAQSHPRPDAGHPAKGAGVPLAGPRHPGSGCPRRYPETLSRRGDGGP